MGKHGDISLIAGEILEELKTIDGLCTKRFHADLTTVGVNYDAMCVGDIVTVNGRKIRITKVGKPCFAECELEDKPCVLAGNVAFGEEVF